MNKINKEVFLWVKGFEGSYDINKEGIIRSYLIRNSKNKRKVPIIIKQSSITTHCGLVYNRVKLRKEGKTLSRYIHRLVCQTFLDNPEDKPQVNHKDSDTQNNNLSNLEWCTNSENQKHINRGKRKIGRDRNSFRICFTSIDGKRTSRNFKKYCDALKFRDELKPHQ